MGEIRKKHDWQPEEVAKVEELYRLKGWSASMVAKEMSKDFGEEISRSTIMGVVNRNGFQRYNGCQNKSRTSRQNYFASRDVVEWDRAKLDRISHLINEQGLTTAMAASMMTRELGRKVSSATIRNMISRYNLRFVSKKKHSGKIGRDNYYHTNQISYTPKPGRSVPLDKIPDEHVTFQELRVSSCRWPFHDGKVTVYCGKRKVEGSSYCDCHFKRSTK